MMYELLLDFFSISARRYTCIFIKYIVLTVFFTNISFTAIAHT